MAELKSCFYEERFRSFNELRVTQQTEIVPRKQQIVQHIVEIPDEEAYWMDKILDYLTNVEDEKSRDLVNGGNDDYLHDGSKRLREMTPTWCRKDTGLWNKNDVLDWVFYTATTNGMDCSILRAESFQTLTGSNLCDMNEAEFSRLEPTYGADLWQLLQILKDKEATNRQRYSDCRFSHISSLSKTQRRSDDVFQHSVSLPEDSPSSSSSVESIPSSPDVDFYPFTKWECEASMEDDDNKLLENLSKTSFFTGNATNGAVIAKQEQPDQSLDHDMVNVDHGTADSTTPAFGDGFTPDQVSTKMAPKHARRSKSWDNSKNGEKPLALWEFLYKTLIDDTYCPHYIRWEDQSKGSFRFIQSDVVAYLWGQTKNNPGMTYEKLSRAMRHYYKRGIMKRVDNRRLVYQFTSYSLGILSKKYHPPTESAIPQ